MPFTPEQIQTIKYEMSAKYQVNFDKELLPLICEIIEHKNEGNAQLGLLQAGLEGQVLQMQKTLEAAALLLHKASSPSKVNQQLFKDNWQAFWHGMGKFGAAACLGLVLGFGGYLIWISRAQQQYDARQIAAFLEQNKQIVAFKALADRSTIGQMKVGNTTVEYIQLLTVFDTSQLVIGKSALIEIKRERKGAKAFVKVPIGIIGN